MGFLVHLNVQLIFYNLSFLKIITDLVYFSHYIQNKAENKAASFTLLNCPPLLLYPVHARNKQQENDANGYGNPGIWIDEHKEQNYDQQTNREIVRVWI